LLFHENTRRIRQKKIAGPGKKLKKKIFTFIKSKSMTKIEICDLVVSAAKFLKEQVADGAVNRRCKIHFLLVKGKLYQESEQE